LAELGVPPYDIVRIDLGTESRFYRLDGDRDAVWGRSSSDEEGARS
jgi:hypothetical protein